MADASVRERRAARALLALLAALYLGFAFYFVPRLTNAHFGDVEFTGWSGPLAERLLRGERPYVDFVLPIPPGSFVVLALIQKVMGKALLQQELWLNHLAQLAMALLAYAFAARLTTRKNSLLVALSTLIALFWLNKECAYDHTAQLLVWASFACGVRALLEPDGVRRDRYWLATGGLAAFTLAFKQSTGVGALLGWGVALAYLALAERFASVPGLLSKRDRARFAGGVALGLLALLLLLLALGSTPQAYLSATFVDGSKLKGGSLRLIRLLIGYVTIREAWTSSIAYTVVLVLIGARILTRGGSFQLGDEPSRAASDRDGLNVPRAAAIGAAMFATFGAAVYLLLARTKPIDPDLSSALERPRMVANLGLVLGCGFFVGQLWPGADATAAERRIGHAVNALSLAILSTSLLHNTSAPEFRAFYDNNPIIPLAFLFLYTALERAGLGPLRYAAALCVLLTLFGGRLDRAIAAQRSIGPTGHWAGMKVGERGRDLALLARHVQSLTAPEDSVLVLPEDLALARLIDRPRPPLIGAIVFVDQYPEHLAPDDILALKAHPPKVVVVHPSEMHLWAQLFRVWSGDSGAQQVLKFAQKELLPQRYRLESKLKTRWVWHDATLEVWVRVD
jgi:hypothetical protein